MWEYLFLILIVLIGIGYFFLQKPIPKPCSKCPNSNNNHTT